MINKLSITFYLLGIVLLSVTAKMWSDKKAQPKLYLTVSEPFDFELFMNSDNYESYGDKLNVKPDVITALYVISSASCSSCINEIISYNYYFKQNGFKNTPVQQFVVVLDSSRKRALRFVKTTEFITPVAFGYDEKYAPFLTTFGEMQDKRQLLLIDNNSQTIFFRIHLRKGSMSSISSKEKILKIAEKAFEKNH